MSYNIDFSLASSDQIEAAFCERLERIRLSRNMTQKQLAEQAGVSLRTIGRLKAGKGVSFDTLIRVLMALRIQQNLASLLPDPSVRPIDRIALKGTERKRARPGPAVEERKTWTWGDEEGKNE